MYLRFTGYTGNTVILQRSHILAVINKDGYRKIYVRGKSSVDSITVQDSMRKIEFKLMPVRALIWLLLGLSSKS